MPTHPPPETLHCPTHCPRHPEVLDAHSEVKAWRLECAVVRIVPITKKIDAPNVSNALIDEHHLSMQSTPSSWGEKGHPRTKQAHRDASCGQHLAQGSEPKLTPKTIEKELHLHATPDCTLQRCNENASLRIIVENVALDANESLSSIDISHKGREHLDRPL